MNVFEFLAVKATTRLFIAAEVIWGTNYSQQISLQTTKTQNLPDEMNNCLGTWFLERVFSMLASMLKLFLM